MKRWIVVAAALLAACSSVAPSKTDAFGHFCRAQSFASCPADTDAPLRLSGESRPRG